jgi:hypothetical protein
LNLGYGVVPMIGDANGLSRERPALLTENGKMLTSLAVGQ